MGARDRGACYSSPVRTELRITGMTCKGCVRHVESALRKHQGVTHVEVSLERGAASVDHQDAISAEELCGVIAEAGYQGTAT